MTDGNILTLEPKRLWHYFNEVCKIPHGTGNEAGLRSYLVEFSEKRGLVHKVDEAGNMVIKKGASRGREGAKTIILQGHLDMVCVKEEGLAHDFQKDPIRPQIDGDWVKAGGTSLGADNGIAVAAALALLEDESLIHGPLECLLTVREEQGMIGAQNLSTDIVSGRTMLNLDSEDPEGTLYIGSAGTAFSEVRFPVEKRRLDGGFAGLSVKVSGLKGGHSGVMIHEQRGNAIKILARILHDAGKDCDFFLADFAGGTATNVIPNTAFAKIAAKSGDISKIEGLINTLAGRIKNELEAIDPGLSVNTAGEDVDEVLKDGLSARIIDFANSAPYGVIKWSYDIKGFVQTSTNLAIARQDDKGFLFSFMSRSSVTSERDAVCKEIASLARLAGFSAEVVNSYPGWKPDLKSPVLGICKNVFKKTFGREPKTKAVHAGLECGIIYEKFGGIDMVALSLDIEGAHSVGERIRISSVADFWRLLTAVLKEFAVN